MKKSEHTEQAAFFDWVRLNRSCAPNPEVRKAMSLCYAVPNGANLPKRRYKNKKGEWKTWCSEAKWLKEEGALDSGLPDVNLDWPIFRKGSGGFFVWFNSGLRIEHKHRDSISPAIKEKIGRGNYTADLSIEQKKKRELLIEAGYKVVISYSAQQSVRAVFEYLNFRIDDYQGIREFLS